MYSAGKPVVTTKEYDRPRGGEIEPPQVEVQLGRMGEAIDCLSATVSKLRTQLLPVSTPYGDVNASESVKEVAPLVPVASDIRSRTSAIIAITEEIELIISHLEV